MAAHRRLIDAAMILARANFVGVTYVRHGRNDMAAAARRVVTDTSVRPWRQCRRSALDRFRDLLAHLGFKQRAIRIFCFVPGD